jgi:catechol-2,3-dioxygenase
VQTAGDLVGILVELSASMELGHDDLGRRNALFLVDAHGNAASVVADRDAVIGVKRDRDGVRMARQRLVDAVVDDLVDHVVQARAVIGVADIHAGPLAHGLQSLENLDGIRAIFFGRGGVFCHA